VATGKAIHQLEGDKGPMETLLTAPDIQEDLLFLPAIASRRAPILLCHLWPIAANPDWVSQRRKWQALQRRVDQR